MNSFDPGLSKAGRKQPIIVHLFVARAQLSQVRYVEPFLLFEIVSLAVNMVKCLYEIQQKNP